MSSHVIAGISGVGRNAAAALYGNGRLAAVCEEGRITRTRDVGIAAGGFPDEALAAVLRTAGASRSEIAEIVAAEDGIPEPAGTPSHRMPHHFAHAATAYLTSALTDAVILVCDTHADQEVSVWRGEAGRIQPVDIYWRGPGFAGLYSRLTRLLGFEAGQDEYHVEALARTGSRASGVAELLNYRDARFEVDPSFDASIEAKLRQSSSAHADVAAAVQGRLGELLQEFLAEIARRTGASALCLGGGLFYNTFFNTVAAGSGLFEKVFVPVNPGNAGLAAGAALARGMELDRSDRPARAASPFLGPAFSNQEIKSVFDNCKLHYEFLEDGPLVQRAVEALSRGELVGWFQDRLEWGTRALGNRSIIASPFAPYVLENLNHFLKHREAYRTYGLAVCEEDVPGLFRGPAASPYMECEYDILDRERFARIAPPGIARVRIQTVGEEPALLRSLLTQFGQASGTRALVNTSFNGLHEPIVCSPRDAVRVFYGTGLDLLVIGSFLLRK